MRIFSIFIALFLTVSCKSSNSTDEYIGTWHSTCIKTVDEENLYIKTEYIISEFEIKSKGYFFSDVTCSTSNTILPEFKGGDFEYDKYDTVTTEQGYKARWYNTSLLSDGEHIDFNLGYYLEGQTLYGVDYSSETKEYSIDFEQMYTKQ